MSPMAILGVIGSVLLLTALIRYWRQLHIDDFRRDVSVGQYCCFEIGDKFVEGKIVGSGVNEVVIEYKGNYYQRQRAEIYPI